MVPGCHFPAFACESYEKVHLLVFNKMKFHLHFIRLQYDEASRPVIKVDILFF